VQKTKLTIWKAPLTMRAELVDLGKFVWKWWNFLMDHPGVFLLVLCAVGFVAAEVASVYIRVRFGAH
jgi:hypothetical protein